MFSTSLMAKENITVFFFHSFKKKPFLFQYKKKPTVSFSFLASRKNLRLFFPFSLYHKKYPFPLHLCYIFFLQKGILLYFFHCDSTAGNNIVVLLFPLQPKKKKKTFSLSFLTFMKKNEIWPFHSFFPPLHEKINHAFFLLFPFLSWKKPEISSLPLFLSALRKK